CDRGAEGAAELVETIPTVKAPLFAARVALTGFCLMGRGHPLSEALLGRVVDNAAKAGYAARVCLANTSTDLSSADRIARFGACVAVRRPCRSYRLLPHGARTPTVRGDFGPGGRQRGQGRLRTPRLSRKHIHRFGKSPPKRSVRRVRRCGAGPQDTSCEPSLP